MSLRHDFKLVQIEIEENKIDFELCMKIMANDADSSYSLLDCIEVEDAVFDFLWFSFQWIPSLNTDYHNESRYSQGINRHGITLFHEESRLALETNCSCWLQLVQYAPDTVQLYNSYIESIEKKDIISFLNRLLHFSSMLNQSNVYVFHFGI